MGVAAIYLIKKGKRGNNQEKEGGLYGKEDLPFEKLT